MPDDRGYVKKNSMLVSGIEFSVLNEGEWVSLSNDEWPSLAGYGSNLDEAISSVKDLIESMLREYSEADLPELTEKAKLFREFLLNSQLQLTQDV